MSTEKIGIEISEDGSRTVKRNLDDVAKSAQSTAVAVRQLQDVLKTLRNANLPPSMKGDIDKIASSIDRLKSLKGDSKTIFGGMTSSKESLLEAKKVVNDLATSMVRLEGQTSRAGLATGTAFTRAAKAISTIGLLRTAAENGVAPVKSLAEAAVGIAPAVTQATAALQRAEPTIQEVARGLSKQSAAAIVAGAGWKNLVTGIRPINETVATFKNLTGSTDAVSGAVNRLAQRFQNYSTIQDLANQRARLAPVAINQQVQAFSAAFNGASRVHSIFNALSGSTLRLAQNYRTYTQALGYGRIPIQQQIAALQMTRFALGAMSTSFGAVVGRIFTLRNALMLMIAQMGLSKIKEYIDAWIGYENNIKLSTQSTEEAAAVQEKLFKVSQETRMSMDTAVPLYRRLAQAQVDLNASQNDMVNLTRAVGMALAIQGTNAEAAKGALLQFGQLLGMARVRAQEFNSINENTPRILLAVAQHVKGAAGSIHTLREMVLKGKVTNKDFFDALLKAIPELEKEFANVTPTISQSFTVFSNALGKYIRDIDKATGGSRAFATAIMFIGNNLPAVIGVLETLGAALLTLAAPWMWSKIVGGFTALLAVGPPGWAIATAAAIVAATVAFANFGDEIKITTVNYDNFQNKLLSKDANELKAAFSPKVDVSALDYVRSMWAEIKLETNSGLNWIKTSFASLSTAVTNLLQPIWDWFIGPWRDALQRAGFSVETIKNPFKLFFEFVVGGIDLVLAGFVGLGSAISTLASTTVTFFTDIFSGKNIFQSFSDAGERVAKAYMDGWKSQFKGGKGQLAQLFDRLQVGAEAAALARTPNLGAANLDTKPKGVPKKPVDLSKDVKAFESLRSSLDPIYAATIHVRDGVKVLDEALAKGIINTTTYEKVYDQLIEKYRDGMNPIGATVRELEEEIAAMGESVLERRGGIEMMQIEAKFRRQNLRLSDEEYEKIEKLVLAKQELKFEQQELEKYYNKFTRPLQEYAAALAVVDKAMKKFGISAAEARQHTAELAMAAGKGDWTDGFIVGLKVLDRQTTNWIGRLGQMMGEVTDAIATGMGEAFGRLIVYGESFTDVMGDISRQILSSLIGALVKLGIQMGLNAVLSATLGAGATGASVAMAATTAAAWAPAAAYVSLASYGMNAASAMAAISTTVGLSKGLALVSGFAAGGYTGNVGRNDVAGVVHGQEFVVNADGTKKNRALLESINRGASPGGGGRSSMPGGAPVVNISVQNHSTAGIEVQQISPTDIRIIARQEAQRAVEQDAPRVVAAQMRDPNSRVSRSLGQSTRTTRRR